MEILETYTLAATVLIGLINWLTFALDRKWKSFALTTLAIIAGTTFGLLGWFDIPSIQMGFAFGVGSSGVYKLIQKAGGY